MRVPAVVGFEIDSEAAYERAITEWFDAFTLIVTSAWNTLVLLVGTTAAGLILPILIKNPPGAVIAGVGALLTLVFDAIWALWAPADLIIEDFKGYTELDLADLTNPDSPVPPAIAFTSPGGIKVEVRPISKEVQYRELRQYVSDEEGSRYTITLRYNRF